MLKAKAGFCSNVAVIENSDGSCVAVIVNPFFDKKVLA